MIENDLTNQTLALDALRYVWKKNPKQARAAYLRFMKGCLYREVAQELNITLERARQHAQGGLYEMGKYLNRKYGKGVAVAA